MKIHVYMKTYIKLFFTTFQTAKINPKSMGILWNICIEDYGKNSEVLYTKCDRTSKSLQGKRANTRKQEVLEQAKCQNSVYF